MPEEEQNLADKKFEDGEWKLQNGRAKETKYDPECSESELVSSLSYVQINGLTTRVWPM